MINYVRLEPIDYLVIGHITQDITDDGIQLGGTATFSSLTAKAMGLRVGVVTSVNPSLDLSILEGIHIYNIPSEQTTTFKNIYTPDGRIQFIYQQANLLNATHIPSIWLNTPIVHLGPVAQEIDPNLPRIFPNAFIGLTPQGWLRSWGESGRISNTDWVEAPYVLSKANAAVLSIEDIGGNISVIDDMVSAIRILALTEADKGVDIYWNGDIRHFSPPQVLEVDATGAGDIFAAIFFIHLKHTKNPWEAGRLANQIAALSVTRSRLDSIPTPDEINQLKIEIIKERSIES